MLGKPGPFQVIESEGCGIVDSPITPPRRRFECCQYTVCLNLAAALNWDNFTCRGCSGEVNEPLLWRARQAMRHDVVMGHLCSIPEISVHMTQHDDTGNELERLIAKIG